LLENGFRKVDYVTIANADSLQPVTEETKNEKAVALIAAFIGDVRLIDNMLL
jgi:pantoate--beta-alanine ligase